MDNPNIEFLLIKDNDGHWYIIQEGKLEAFNTWLESEDYEDGIAPAWVKEVGGSQTLVKFKEYRIK